METPNVVGDMIKSVTSAKTRLILTEDGIWAKEIRTYAILGDQDATLAAMYQNRPLWLPRFYKEWSILQFMPGGPNDVLLIKMFDKLALKTEWAPGPGETLIPVFRKGATSVVTEYTWIPPVDTKLAFVFQRSTSLAYLFIVKPVQTSPALSLGFFRLPISNLYNNGKICMGQIDVNAYEKVRRDMVESAQFLFDSVQSSFWNADLTDSYTQAFNAPMFSFKPDGTQVPVAKSTVTQLARLVTPQIETLVEKGYLNDLWP